MLRYMWSNEEDQNRNQGTAGPSGSRTEEFRRALAESSFKHSVIKTKYLHSV